VGSSPSSVEAEDVDLDGDLDIVVLRQGTYNLSVLLNNGDATFADPVSYSTGVRPHAISTGDINGDGHADVTVVRYVDDTLAILINNGDGTFQRRVEYAISQYPISVFVANLDDDGSDDIAVANMSAYTVSVFKNDGQGFYYGEDYAIRSPGPMTSGDLDVDGHPELVLAHGADSIVVMMNDGQGNFQPGSRLRAPHRCQALVLNDLSGDGIRDLAAAEFSDFDNVSIWTNDGSGGFSSRQDYSLRLPALGIASADFDLDGFADLAITDASDSFTVLYGSYDGTFPWIIRKPSGPDTKSIISADFDNDGDIDLAFGGASSGFISLVENTGNRTFFAPRTYDAGLYNIRLAAGDFALNGRLDLAAIGDSGGYYVMLINISPMTSNSSPLRLARLILMAMMIPISYFLTRLLTYSAYWKAMVMEVSIRPPTIMESSYLENRWLWTSTRMATRTSFFRRLRV
jgi:hypothetical protein